MKGQEFSKDFLSAMTGRREEKKKSFQIASNYKPALIRV